MHGYSHKLLVILLVEVQDNNELMRLTGEKALTYFPVSLSFVIKIIVI